VLTVPLLYDDGVVTHVLEMALDASEHLKLQEQLSRAEAVRAALLENALEATLVLDEKGKVVLANHAAEELLGEKINQLIGHRPRSGLLPAEVWRVLRDKRQRVLSESQLSRADGTTVAVRTAVCALESDGQLMGFTVSIQDLGQGRRENQAEEGEAEPETNGRQTKEAG
jgi:PAS domain S-box-containing protein